jgi:hypothetical protein
MRLYKSCRLEFNRNLFVYWIFESERNGIGEYGVKQISAGCWHNLNTLDLGEE